VQATLKLSRTWPYAYDYENEQKLTGTYLELFGHAPPNCLD
jgi:hypothetical protein